VTSPAGPVRWGFLGAGFIASRALAPAVHAADGAVLQVAGARDPARAEALGPARSVGSYEQVCASDDVDAVYVALANDDHITWVLAALAAGKHVLCEKPLAMSAAQAEQMVDSCRDAGVLLAEAFMYRHHPTWVETVRLVRDGAIGELQGMQMWFSYYNDDPANIRNKPENGGGALMDIGCYPINIARLLFDDEPAAIASRVRRDPQMGVDTLTSAVLEFPGGGQATFSVGIRSEPYQRTHVVGSAGRIEVEIPVNIPWDVPTHLFLTTGGAAAEPTTRTLTFDPANQYTIQAELFGQAVLDGTPLPVPPSDAVANMRVIEGVLAAAR